MKESSFVTDAIRKSSEKTKTLFQAHIGNLYLGRNHTAYCYNLKADWLEMVLLYNGNGHRSGLGCLFNHPLWIRLFG